MDDIIDILNRIEEKIDKKHQNTAPSIVSKLENENKKLKKINESLNFILDNLTKPKKFKIEKSNKIYEIVNKNIVFENKVIGKII